MAIEKISRRAVVSGLGAGLVDPTTKYPRPPFEGQQQEWPSLAGKMDPRPDDGEKSYKGSGRLQGRKALITGGFAAYAAWFGDHRNDFGAGIRSEP